MAGELEAMRQRLPKWARDGILAGYRGSHAHGLYVPPEEPSSTDDIDVFQVTVQPPDFYLGLGGWGRQRQHYETAGESLDIVVYDIRKFVSLLCKGNPNVHVWLWSRPEHYFVRTPAAEILITNRHRLLSQRVLNSLTGYAAHQLKRMTHYEHRGYMGEKRKELVRQYGYDCKNAAHCLRLLHMGIELATEHKINSYRTWDRELLLTVKAGGWTLDKVKDYAENKFASFNNARAVATLQAEVKDQVADSILLAAMRRHWEDKECLQMA